MNLAPNTTETANYRQNNMTSKLVEKAIKLISATGADYGDVRLAAIRREHVLVRNGRFRGLREASELAIGVRVLVDGAWGFAGTTDVSESGLKNIVREARANAAAQNLMKQFGVELAKEPAHRGSWQTPIQRDPWSVPAEEKKDFLIDVDSKFHCKFKGPETLVTQSQMEFFVKDQIFASTQGSRIEQKLFRSTASAEIKLFHKGRKIRRAFPGPTGGNYQGAGYEAVLGLDWHGASTRLLEEAREGLRAPEPPEKNMDLILTGSPMALQIHETIGHAVELDRVYGYEDNLGGRTYLVPDHLRKLQVASPIVNFVASDPAMHARGAGTVKYDDEGVLAKKTDVIQNGLFVGYMNSRETAQLLGLSRSNGCAVAADALNYPLVRMTNLSLLPGKSSLKAMIESTEEGILMDNESSWSIDDERSTFQIGAEIGWHIRRGKIAGMFRSPVYSGRSIDFWRSCDAIAGKKEWVLWGFADCTKGAPPQLSYVSHGAAPARFRGIQVGK
ncbi:MAG: TldD/PmbA family protein [Candidatus Omnitrophica bacterium]|nr:TldD/PmbA family protein [Candidatus Omnitrophota bacterium]